MPLADLQTALGTLVVARAASSLREHAPWSLDGLDLTVEERDWLDRLVSSRGLEVTCFIQRWWRQTRVRWATPLTLAVLGPQRSAELLDAYLNAVPCASLFFTPEALGFLDFVLEQELDVPHLPAIARFEQALLSAAEVSSSPHDPPAAIVVFDAQPELLLGALLAGQVLPEPGAARYPVLVAPGLPHLWRTATEDEACRRHDLR